MTLTAHWISSFGLHSPEGATLSLIVQMRKTESQRGKATCPGLRSWEVAGLTFPRGQVQDGTGLPNTSLLLVSLFPTGSNGELVSEHSKGVHVLGGLKEDTCPLCYPCALL